MSGTVKKCISSWHKIMPDYECILWNTDNFDINSVPFVKQAFEMQKWAFAADYIRLYAIYKEGGIYLDTDVYVKKNFNNFLKYNFFSSLERDLTTISLDSEYAVNFRKNESSELINNDMKRIEGFCLQAAIFGACAGNEYIKDCMLWYENNNFSIDYAKKDTMLVAPDIYAAILQKYGFKYISGLQQLNNNMIIFPADYFPNGLYNTKNAYALHLCENSWSNTTFTKKIINKFKKNNFLRTLFGKNKI